jgi:L-ribulose-5-phosphate 3-epimerase
MHSLLSTRRCFLGAAAGLACTHKIAFGWTKPVRIGVTDWNLNLSAKPESVKKAAELGFQGVQISFGRELVNGKLPADQPEVIARYLSLSQQNGVAIDGTCVDRLHDNGLKSDPLAPEMAVGCDPAYPRFEGQGSFGAVLRTLGHQE